jgi:hypothetical protein
MLRKNVAGQHLPFVLVNSTSGAVITGASVTARRTIDGGAQGGCTGAVTELANGQYDMALSQADTNGNNIGYLFTATSALPVHFTVVTTAADPTSATNFGLTNLDAAISTLPSAASITTAVWAAGTRSLTTFGTVASDVWAVATRTLTAASDTSGVTTLLSRIGSALTITGGKVDITDSASITAIKAKTDNLPAAPAAVSDIPTANANADALLDRVDGIETGWTLRQAVRIVLSALGGKLSGAATTAVSIRNVTDAKPRITATVDADGNRSAVTYDKT